MEAVLSKNSAEVDSWRFYPDLAGRVTIVEQDGASATVLGGEGELWRILGFAMLACLLIESFLAWRFGRR